MNLFRKVWTWWFGPTISELVLRQTIANLWAEFNRRHQCPPETICLPPAWFWAAVKYVEQFDDHLTNASPIMHGFVWFHGMRVQSNFCNQARCENSNLNLWADLDPKTGAIVAEYAGQRRHVKNIYTVVGRPRGLSVRELKADANRRTRDLLNTLEVRTAR